MATSSKQFTIKNTITFGDKSYRPGQEDELASERADRLQYLSEQGAIEGYEAAADESTEDVGDRRRKGTTKTGAKK